MADCLDDNDLELERHCGKCIAGIVYDTKQPCTNCEGTGYYLTVFGKRVSEFVVKRMTMHFTKIAMENLKRFS